MTEIIAAVIGAFTAYILAKFGMKKPTFSDMINDSGFTVYSDSKSPSEIWKDFREDFKSYNDSWRMELKSPEEYINVHRKRYNDPESGMFRFLFFIGNDIGQFERFVKFQSLVHLDLKPNDLTNGNFKNTLQNKISKIEMPSTLNKIEVFLSKQKHPNQTFFRGYKKSDNSDEPDKISIWYLSMDSSKEEPHLILKSLDERFWEELNKEWNNSRVGAEKILGSAIFERYLQMESKHGSK